MTNRNIFDGILTSWEDRQIVENECTNCIENSFLRHDSYNEVTSVCLDSSDDNEDTSNPPNCGKSEKHFHILSKQCTSANQNAIHSAETCSNLRLTSQPTSITLSLPENTIDDSQLNEPTALLLDYCKQKFLRPYLIILYLVGLSPISTDLSKCRQFLSHLQTLLIFLLLVFGHFLQYMCSFRSDQGFNIYKLTSSSNKTNTYTTGEICFGYVIPNAVYVIGFLLAVFVCKLGDNEHLQNLIERVFLMSKKPIRLCRCLWAYVTIGLILQSLFIGYVIYSVLKEAPLNPIFQTKLLPEFLNNIQLIGKIGVLLILFLQHLVETIILTNYILQCQLLSVYLQTISQNLLMHSIDPLDWMRELIEVRKLLDYLNRRIALPVSIFIIYNLSNCLAAFIHLFRNLDSHFSDIRIPLFNMTNALLWLMLGLVPFLSAASLTHVCRKTKNSGHEIRVRRFCYQNSSIDELNSLLIFTSSLHLSAEVFWIPISPNYLCFIVMIIFVTLLTIGIYSNFSGFGNL